jgi:hypothetical protein
MDETTKLMIQSILRSAMIDAMISVKRNPQQTHEQALMAFMQSVLEQLREDDSTNPLGRVTRQLEALRELEREGKAEWRRSDDHHAEDEACGEYQPAVVDRIG